MDFCVSLNKFTAPDFKQLNEGSSRSYQMPALWNPQKDTLNSLFAEEVVIGHAERKITQLDSLYTVHNSLTPFLHLEDVIKSS